MEPLINYARSAFLLQKLQIVRGELSDSSTATAEANNVRDAAFAAKPGWDGPLQALRPRFSSLIGNNPAALAKAGPERPQRLRRARA
jgi:hypothetical protein